MTTVWFLILSLSAVVPMESRTHCLRAAEILMPQATAAFCLSSKGEVRLPEQQS